MRLDPRFCEVQPARALYRGGVNNGGCIYESEKVRSKPFSSCRWVACCKLRRATCNRQPSQTARRTSHVASLCPGLWTDHRQRRRRLHVADCSSQNRCQACAHGVDRAAWSGCKPASRNRGQGRGQLWFALSQFAGRKVQEFEQEGLSSRGQIACLQGAGCMKCPRSGVVSGGLHI